MSHTSDLLKYDIADGVATRKRWPLSRKNARPNSRANEESCPRADTYP